MRMCVCVREGNLGCGPTYGDVRSRNARGMHAATVVMFCVVLWWQDEVVETPSRLSRSRGLSVVMLLSSNFGHG